MVYEVLTNAHCFASPNGRLMIKYNTIGNIIHSYTCIEFQLVAWEQFQYGW